MPDVPDEKAERETMFHEPDYPEGDWIDWLQEQGIPITTEDE